jgi:O-acetyl-ADP-ribose deacetylase (regulator of RNase III)
VRISVPRGVPTVLFLAALLTGCSDDTPATSTPTTGTAPSAAAPAATAAATSSIVGLLVSADENQVVINLPDGNARTFGVRPEDAPRLGIRHLASHAGLTDIGFEITYVTVDGKDYVVAAQETAPPQ